jgi:competence protein ComEC
MLGIFCFYRRIELLLYVKNKLLRKIWQGTAIGFAAQLMTAPLSLYYFHQSLGIDHIPKPQHGS